MRTCKNCEAPLADNNNSPFCNRECQLEQDIADLKNENITLEQRIRLLNCQRTQIWPDITKTLDGNISDAEIAFQGYVHELSSDEILLLMKKAEVIAAQCWLVVQKKNIKDTNSKKVEQKIKKAEDTREDNAAKSPLELAKIRFQRECIAKGFSESEANKLWQAESGREKAIIGFMKSLKLTREAAEKMVNSLPGMEKMEKK